MTTERLYREDPYLLEFDARIARRLEHDGRPAVILDRSAFYPESGGQPWDTGTLGGVPVVAVVDQDGELLHVLASPLAAEAVAGRVDAERRRDHREQHHGQHLLSRAFEDVAQAATVSFHLGADEVTIDLDREVSDGHLRAAEDLTNRTIWSARPVTVRVVSQAEARRLGLHPPEDAGDAVRLVEAEGFDLQPCGGTHPRSTSEVGIVVVLGRERHKGGSRIRFVCGQRAVAAFRTRNGALDRLTSLFSTSIEALPEAAQRVLDGRSAAEKRVRELLLQSLDAEAQRLLSSHDEVPAVVAAVYDGWDAETLRGLAQRLVTARPCVALLGSRSDKAYLTFAQSEGLPHDVPALLKTALAGLGGRGGGKGNLAQGAGSDLAALDAVLARAAGSVR